MVRGSGGGEEGPRVIHGGEREGDSKRGRYEATDREELEPIPTAEQAESLLIERGGEEEVPHIAEPGEEAALKSKRTRNLTLGS